MSPLRLPLARAATAFVLASVGLASIASADYQVRGRFLYRDRVFGSGGFTGSDVDRPIRHADVQVIDAADAVRGTGSTDSNGNFTIDVVDNQVRNIRIRVMTKADNTPIYKLVVKHTTSMAVFALISPTYTSHPSNQDIDFTATPVVALQTANSATIGEPFNIFDMGIDAWDFVATVNGGNRPTRVLTILWSRGSDQGTFYDHGSSLIKLLGLTDDSDGYDDTVILHEIGHYIEFNMADSDNTGGGHSLNGYYPLPLTWSEGFATFFNNNVRAYKGVARSDIYVDTAGQPGPGQAFISYEVETPSAGLIGANNEVSVNAALWDITDTPTTPDATVGSDDDGLALPNGFQDFWDVFVGYFPSTTSISMEDFWDGWFAPQYAKGHAAEMRAAFTARGIEYFDDAFENDDAVAQAKTVVAGSPQAHHTTYGAGDEDWAIIAVQGGSPYTFETNNLLSAADTRLDLFASNGTTTISVNDDRLPGDPSSLISYTPPASAIVYLRCRRKNDAHTYGSFDIQVTGTPVAVAVSDVTITGEPDGIRLRWRAERSGEFSHFEVERGPQSTGPWAVLDGGPVPSENTQYFWLDADVVPGQDYFYRIVGVEATGERQAFGPFGATAFVPRLVLHGPQPNPFNPTTTIAFELPRTARPTVAVYSADGRLVRSLLQGTALAAGPHTLRWDGRDDRGEPAASGVYLIRLESDGRRLVRRAVLLR